jgi:hypothetical protein
MTCEQFRQNLPEFPEGVQDTAQEAHAKSCPECSDLLSDLDLIIRRASLLQADAEPSPRVWNSIELVLRQEGLIRQPGQPAPRKPSLWNQTRTWTLLPVAAALLMGFGLVLHQRQAAQPHALLRDSAAVVSAPSPAQTRRAVPVEDQQILEAISSRAPAMRATYEANLQDVNAYIQDAEESAQRDPNDEDAQQNLMDAYEQKAVVYQMALDRTLP